MLDHLLLAKIHALHNAQTFQVYKLKHIFRALQLNIHFNIT